jgi:uncharacterized protein DUF4105
VRRALFGAIVCWTALGPKLGAQNPQPAPPATPGLQVWLMTIGQGEQVWEKFGHNALWFVDTVAGVDVAYNWGIFDFAQPGFLRRFLTGDTRYWVEGYPGGVLIDYYRRADRDVGLQRLNLTPAQVAKAFEYAQWNARDENKFYRYDYFRDNCSTRVRDVIDLALGGWLKARTADSGQRTYRSEALRLVDDLKITQLGMDIALGEPADKRLTVWEEMFIPMRMRDALRGIQVPGITESMAPLIVDERTLYRSQTHQERPDAPRRWPVYALIGLLLAVELAIVGRFGERSGAAEKVFRVEAMLWAFLVGVLGLILLLAWTTTQHVFWYRNENLLVINPLSLWLGVLTAMSMRTARWLRPAAICAIVIAMLGAVALIINGLPGFPQDNLAIILLFLPPHFALAHGLWKRARLPRAEYETAAAVNRGGGRALVR